MSNSAEAGLDAGLEAAEYNIGDVGIVENIPIEVGGNGLGVVGYSDEYNEECKDE